MIPVTEKFIQSSFKHSISICLSFNSQTTAKHLKPAHGIAKQIAAIIILDSSRIVCKSNFRLESIAHEKEGKRVWDFVLNQWEIKCGTAQNSKWNEIPSKHLEVI